MTHSVGIYLFDDVEVLDFAGPYEVFTTASRMHARNHPSASPLFAVSTVALTLAPVRARAGLILAPERLADELPRLDVLVIPGGVVTAELGKPAVTAWIARMAQQVPLISSVCTGAFLLGKAGLLEGRSATTHWEDADELQGLFPTTRVVRDVRWVDEGAVVTSGGISAGIDMSLHLVERLAGRALAERTARQMEFEWTENRAR